MEEGFLFLNLEGLNDLQVKDLNDLLHPANLNNEVEFPWSNDFMNVKPFTKGDRSSWNVHAPVFESSVLKTSTSSLVYNSNDLSTISHNSNPELNCRIKNSPLSLPAPSDDYAGQVLPVDLDVKNLPSNKLEQLIKEYEKETGKKQISETKSHSCVISNTSKISQETVSNFCVAQYPKASSSHAKVSDFKFNPSASSFVPQKTPFCISNGAKKKKNISLVASQSEVFQGTSTNENSCSVATNNGLKDHKTDSQEKLSTDGSETIKASHKATAERFPDSEQATPIDGLEFNQNLSSERNSNVTPVSSSQSARSWADVLKSGTRINSHDSVTGEKPVVENGNKVEKYFTKESETEKSSVLEDKLSLPLGKHLYQLELNFQPVFLQPRGLINRRNWCYINASLQALLACPPFYTLLRNLPLGPAVDRGKSSTPVIDSMVKIAYEFAASPTPQEEMQPGSAFQPKHIYEMLGDLKSDCLKGQQEDAEEFLSYILNGMHEEMVAIIRNYEKQHHLEKSNEDSKLNGCADASEGEEEWQVIGTKQKGMVTRKVAEHSTPISELLGGQIKSFLTICGNKTSASVQPFFTLQLDIQSENVTSVLEALNQMSVKEPIQGYTCAKTKKEVEAYSHIALQKLPPILILHLKRFVYNKNGGCKKVMKKTDYPIKLELKRDLFSPEVKRSQCFRFYTLFAVMYHDGEEAVKGHYISDIYNHGSKNWIRCDDRAIMTVSEDQVLSHSPPRVPYLLFYQVSDSLSCSSL